MSLLHRESCKFNKIQLRRGAHRYVSFFSFNLNTGVHTYYHFYLYLYCTYTIIYQKFGQLFIRLSSALFMFLLLLTVFILLIDSLTLNKVPLCTVANNQVSFLFEQFLRVNGEPLRHSPCFAPPAEHMDTLGPYFRNGRHVVT